MALVDLREILRDALQGRYAVGGFDTWNVDSIQAIVAAAEETRSPTVVLAEPEEIKFVGDEFYIAAARLAAERASVPVAIQWNETDDPREVHRAIQLGFNAVMIENRGLSPEEYESLVAEVVRVAHSAGVAVEAEIGNMPEAKGAEIVEQGTAYTPFEAARFVESTGVDALSVPFGNVHGLRDRCATLDLEYLSQVREAVDVALVAHGGTGIAPRDIEAAIQRGISMIKVGTCLRRAYTKGMMPIKEEDIGYIAPLLKTLGEARRTLQQIAQDLMVLYGSAGMA
jgi:ketose-bisphosphate aldolase